MRKFLKAILACGALLLGACTVKGEINDIGGKGNSSTTYFYLDNSLAKGDGFEISTESASSYESSSGNCSLTVKLLIKNTTTKTKVFRIKNHTLTREETSATYKVTFYSANGYFASKDDWELDSDISGEFVFNATIPSQIEKEHYVFSVSVNGFVYTLKLYETPDEKRENIPVHYQVSGSIVRTTYVKRGRALEESYLYESADHLVHCSTWKRPDGWSITANRIITEETTLVGSAESNMMISGEQGASVAMLLRISYVPTDGVIAVPSKYNGRTVNNVSNYVITNLLTLKTLYLPATLTKIYNGNFERCPKLTTINFAGSQSQWEAMEKTSTIPTGVALRFNQSFAAAN